MVYGIQTQQINKRLTNKGDCDITQTSCSFLVQGKTIGVGFLKTPITEEELFLDFSLENGLTIKKAWIEGINMYMGKTPIMFESTNSPLKGVTFLGSCNLREMKWRLYIEIGVEEHQDQNAAPTQLVSTTFSTFL